MAMLVDARFQKFLDLGQFQIVIAFSDDSLHGNMDADEPAAFSVLAFARFEPTQISGAFRVGGPSESALRDLRLSRPGRYTEGMQIAPPMDWPGTSGAFCAFLPRG
jgi:hypothetical protein